MNTGCEVSAKAVPQTTILPAALKTGNFEVRTNAAVRRINKVGNRAVSVTYVDAQGNGVVGDQRLYQLVRQPAPIVDRQLEIEFLDAGVEAFAFTFG